MSNLSVAEWRVWKNAPSDPLDAVVQDAIDAAEGAIGDACARYFAVATGTPSTRTYVPATYMWPLRIHDCVAVTTLTNNGTVVSSGNYQLEPVGQTWSGHARPFTHVNLLTGSWSTDNGRATISVLADWGWAALPAAYIEAVKILSADILDQKDIRNGVAGFGDFGAIRVRENATVAKLIRPFLATESFGIA